MKNIEKFGNYIGNSGKKRAWFKFGKYGGGLESDDLIGDFAKLTGIVLLGTTIYKTVIEPLGEVALSYAKKKLSDWGWIRNSQQAGQQVNDSTYVAEEPVAETLNQTCDKPHEDLSKYRLVGDLVFSGDTIVMYSSDGIGKSTLAMNICIDVAAGSPTSLLPVSEAQQNPTPELVLYYDAELNDEDIQMRYGGNGYVYPTNLKRISHVFNSINDLFADIGKRTENITSDVLVCIDPLGAVIPTSSPNAAREFFVAQDNFKKMMLQKGRRVTFIVVIHTTKTTPGKINENFYGSAHIGNYAATRFAMLPTRFGNDFRMLKVQKNRKFGNDDNVIVVKFVSEPYEHYEYYATVPMADAMPVIIKQPIVKPEATPTKTQAPNQKITPEQEQKIKEMLANGIRYKDIAKKFHVDPKTIQRYNNKFGNNIN